MRARLNVVLDSLSGSRMPLWVSAVSQSSVSRHLSPHSPHTPRIQVTTRVTSGQGVVPPTRTRSLQTLNIRLPYSQHAATLVRSVCANMAFLTAHNLHATLLHAPGMARCSKCAHLPAPVHMVSLVSLLLALLVPGSLWSSRFSVTHSSVSVERWLTCSATCFTSAADFPISLKTLGAACSDAAGRVGAERVCQSVPHTCSATAFRLAGVTRARCCEHCAVERADDFAAGAVDGAIGGAVGWIRVAGGVERALLAVDPSLLSKKIRLRSSGMRIAGAAMSFALCFRTCTMSNAAAIRMRSPAIAPMIHHMQHVTCRPLKQIAVSTSIALDCG